MTTTPDERQLPDPGAPSVRVQKWMAVFLTAFFCLFYFVQNHNHRFKLPDFRVYYTAAQKFTAGDKVYGQAYGVSTGYYKYSPAALAVFVPLSWLSFFAAGTVYFFLSVLVMILVWSLLGRFSLRLTGRPASLAVMLGAFLVAGVHLFREMDLGNVNLLLLLAALAALKLLLDRRETAAGILLGCMVLFKPHFLILGPLLLFTARFKLILSWILTVAVGLFWPAVFAGWERNLSLLAAWKTAMTGHNSVTAVLRDSNTVQHWLAFLLPSLKGVTPVAGLILAGIVAFLTRIAGRKPDGLAVPYLCLVALIPNFTVTDTEHFLFALPLVLYLLASLRNMKPAARVAAIAACILYGANWPDVWTRHLTSAINDSGALGIGNLLIVGLSLAVRSPAAR